MFPQYVAKSESSAGVIGWTNENTKVICMILFNHGHFGCFYLIFLFI